MYAALLLLPAAGLPPLPKELGRPRFAGLEYAVVAPWGGTFRFHADGRYEHRCSDLKSYPGWWEVCGGVLTVTEVREDFDRTPIGYAVYRFRLRPDPSLWWSERRLTGTYEQGEAAPSPCALRSPRRIKP